MLLVRALKRSSFPLLGGSQKTYAKEKKDILKTFAKGYDG